MESISLNGNWLFREYKTENIEWLDAKVPGSILADFIHLEQIDDPFYRDNELCLLPLFAKNYEYKKTFIVSQEILSEDYIKLNFLGIDTIATIYLNDQEIGQTKNMHRTYHFQIKDYLHEGENEIRVTLRSPLAYIEAKNNANPLQGNGDSIPGLTHIRKAQYMFGWDWGPTLPDLGIWKDVFIEAYSEAKIDSIHILQEHLDDQVNLNMSFEIENFESGTYQVNLAISSPSQESINHVMTLDDLEGHLLTIENPELWWPNGLGDQNLYHFKFSLLRNGLVLDTHELKIGLRELKVITDQDQFGNEFSFAVNQRKIFAMGANYIPEDSLLTRVNREKTERLIKDCVAANFNMIRVWGGGYYPDSFFYELCDQYGLIVWQDLMFACGVYPYNDNDFVEEAKAETFDNLKRIRNHASLGLICGNNEIEMFFGDGRIPATTENKMQYLTFFEDNLQEWVSQLVPNTFYWSSSPSSGEIFQGTNDEDSGDGHNWDVWHGEAPIESYQETYNRFMSEFGFQSFPSMKTIEAFTSKKDRNLFSHVMDTHQKNKAGNMKIFTYLARHYLFPKDLTSFVYLSQLLQAEAIKTGVEHWRQNRGRCMGALYWQLNDCWPAPSWSSVDYFGRWKALHYAAKKFYQPLLLSIKKTACQVSFFLTNDCPNDHTGTIQWQLLKQDGELIRSGQMNAEIKSLSAKNIFTIDFSDEFTTYNQDELILVYQLIDSDQIANRNYQTSLFVTPKEFQLTNPNLILHIDENDQEFLLTIETDVYAKNVEIVVESEDVVFSDNYFDVVPNLPYTVQIAKDQLKGTYTADDFKQSINFQSVFNTYEY